ncbi:YHYH domain-containing protein, partial [Pseudomonas aeruginosa]|uniref:YHYH domain-containing protein n=1 Tax=Pseudomonas aeruginosa TaxID=287 RepID=UPI00405426BA
HFHTDHPVFSCSIIEQKQLNTWVSFQSAEQPLLGQFSVSGNTLCSAVAVAHSGGTDSKGCHTNHSTGEYHCH